MDMRQQKISLVGLTALVWVTALGLAVAGRVRLAARAPTTVTVTTWPPSVHLIVDGEKQFDGRYVLTPVNVTLSPGRHKITLSRDGYFAQTSEIEDTTGRTIEMNNVVLQRNAALSFAAVEIEMPDGDAAIGYSLDEGFAAGETPALIDDLAADLPHVLTLFSSSQESKSGKYRCRFTAPLPELDAPPLKIRVRAMGSSFKATNCHRLKPKR